MLIVTEQSRLRRETLDTMLVIRKLEDAVFPAGTPSSSRGCWPGSVGASPPPFYRTDIDWKRGRIHVQRTWSDKAGRIEEPKDSKGRYVKASPALLEALRAHLEAAALEAQINRWTPEQRQLVFPNKAGRARPERGPGGGVHGTPMLSWLRIWVTVCDRSATR